MITVRRMASVLTFAWAVAASSAAADVAIDIASEEIVVHVTPRAEVFLIVVAREPMPYHWRIVKRTDIAADTDGDGIVRFTRTSFSDQAVYAAFDLTSGQSAIAYPAGFQQVPDERVRPRLADGWRPHQRSFDVQALYVDAVLLRAPGKVWYWEGGDGVEDDGDATVGTISVHVDALQPLRGTTSPPYSIRPSDLLLFIRDDTLEAVIGRAGGAQ